MTVRWEGVAFTKIFMAVLVIRWLAVSSEQHDSFYEEENFEQKRVETAIIWSRVTTKTVSKQRSFGIPFLGNVRKSLFHS